MIGRKQNLYVAVEKNILFLKLLLHHLVPRSSTTTIHFMHVVDLINDFHTVAFYCLVFRSMFPVILAYN